MEDHNIQETSMVVRGGGKSGRGLETQSESPLRMADNLPMESPQTERIDRGITHQEQDNVLSQISKSLFGEPETN
jgi:hypothetical protein